MVLGHGVWKLTILSLYPWCSCMKSARTLWISYAASDQEVEAQSPREYLLSIRPWHCFLDMLRMMLGEFRSMSRAHSLGRRHKGQTCHLAQTQHDQFAFLFYDRSTLSPTNFGFVGIADLGGWDLLDPNFREAVAIAIRT